MIIASQNLRLQDPSRGSSRFRVPLTLSPLDCHMIARSHDRPVKNSIGSTPIRTLNTGIEHGTRRWNMTMKGRFCDGEGH